jgi:hypothetical protein
MEKIVVTRHPALIQLLLERGIVQGGTEVVGHATAEMVRGRHVIGVLPLELAAEAEMVTVVPLAVPPEMRGRELTVEEVRRYAGEPKTYRVTGSTRWYGFHESIRLVDGPSREEVEYELGASLLGECRNDALIWEEGRYLEQVTPRQRCRVERDLEGLCETADFGAGDVPEATVAFAAREADRLAAAMGRTRPEYQPHLGAAITNWGRGETTEEL